MTRARRPSADALGLWLFLPVNTLWIILGPGWPLGWLTVLPFLIWLAYLLGWSLGARDEREWRRRQDHERTRLILRAAKSRDACLLVREKAMWN